MSKTPKERQVSLLASLLMTEGRTAMPHALRDTMLTVHNTPMSALTLHGDLLKLHEMGLVIYRTDEAAQITERGVDVAMGIARWPGRD